LIQTEGGGVSYEDNGAAGGLWGREQYHPAVEELKPEFARLLRERLEVEESDIGEDERRAAVEGILKRQMRAAFLTHAVATEDDFERLWPRLRDDALCEHATNVYFQLVDAVAEDDDFGP
jgi:hypothetical protein